MPTWHPPPAQGSWPVGPACVETRAGGPGSHLRKKTRPDPPGVGNRRTRPPRGRETKTQGVRDPLPAGIEGPAPRGVLGDEDASTPVRGWRSNKGERPRGAAHLAAAHRERSSRLARPCARCPPCCAVTTESNCRQAWADLMCVSSQERGKKQIILRGRGC